MSSLPILKGDPVLDGLSHLADRGGEAGTGSLGLLHCLSDPVRVGDCWWVKCACGWLRAFDRREDVPLVCGVADAEADLLAATFKARQEFATRKALIDSVTEIEQRHLVRATATV